MGFLRIVPKYDKKAKQRLFPLLKELNYPLNTALIHPLRFYYAMLGVR